MKFKKRNLFVLLAIAILTLALSIFCIGCDLDSFFGTGTDDDTEISVPADPEEEPDTGNTDDKGDTGDTGKTDDTGKTEPEEDKGNTEDKGDDNEPKDPDKPNTGDTGNTGGGSDTDDPNKGGDTDLDKPEPDDPDKGDTGDTEDTGDAGDTGDGKTDPDDPVTPDPDKGDTDDDYNGELVSGSLEEISDAKFSIHFLELGNKYAGDSTLIKCGDVEVLIDAGSRKGSASTLKEYIDKYCTDGILEYVIVTHAHQDHIAGFVGNKSGAKYSGILYSYKIGTIIEFGGHNTTSDIYNNYCTAVSYAVANGATKYTATQCWYQNDGAKKQYFLDSEKTLSMNILYNYYYEHATSDENDYSVCMLLKNVVGDKTYNYLFTGDLEEEGEKYLVQNNNLPEVELFKGGHHGSYTATTEALLSVIKPKAVAVCCCAGSPEYTTNSANTFPSQAFVSRVAKYTDKIYVTSLATDVPETVEGVIQGESWNYTSMNGNIVFYYSNKWKLYCTNNDTILKETDWFKANRVWPTA